MKLSSGQNDVLSSLLDESLDARIGLVEKTKSLDELGKVGWRKGREISSAGKTKWKVRRDDSHQGSWVPERLGRWEATEREKTRQSQLCS